LGLEDKLTKVYKLTTYKKTDKCYWMYCVELWNDTSGHIFQKKTRKKTEKTRKTNSQSQTKQKKTTKNPKNLKNAEKNSNKMEKYRKIQEKTGNI